MTIHGWRYYRYLLRSVRQSAGLLRDAPPPAFGSVAAEYRAKKQQTFEICCFFVCSVSRVAARVSQPSGLTGRRAGRPALRLVPKQISTLPRAGRVPKTIARRAGPGKRSLSRGVQKRGPPGRASRPLPCPKTNSNAPPLPAGPENDRAPGGVQKKEAAVPKI